MVGQDECVGCVVVARARARTYLACDVAGLGGFNCTHVFRIGAEAHHALAPARRARPPADAHPVASRALKVGGDDDLVVVGGRAYGRNPPRRWLLWPTMLAFRDARADLVHEPLPSAADDGGLLLLRDRVGDRFLAAVIVLHQNCGRRNSTWEKGVGAIIFDSDDDAIAAHALCECDAERKRRNERKVVEAWHLDQHKRRSSLPSRGALSLIEVFR